MSSEQNVSFLVAPKLVGEVPQTLDFIDKKSTREPKPVGEVPQTLDFIDKKSTREPKPVREVPQTLDSAPVLWNKLKAQLKSQFKGQILDSVLSAVTLENNKPGQKTHITLKIPSSFHQNFLKSRLSQIQSKTQALQVKIKFALDPKTVPMPALPSKKELKKNNFRKTISKPRAFHPDWTFSSFIEGPGNVFAFSLAQSIAKNPFKNSSNPLFIYGPSGLGKTHLLHAIGNALTQKQPHLKVLYLPAERLFNDCISHIRKNEMPLFREKYRKNIQVLLLDDIPILGRGESTQEEFFHTYESLKQAGCQIILTSDQRPKNIKGLKARIQTRFEGGVVADIQAPDKDTKKAIIKAKACRKGIKIAEEIISYIANMPISSVRELEGHINKIKMFCELRGQSLSFPLFKQIFAEELSICSRPNKKTEPTFFTVPKTTAPVHQIKKIQKTVCAHFHLSLAELKSPSREKSVVLARNIAIYLMRENLSMTLSDIGAFFGGRNHSTLLNSLKNIKKSLREDKKLQNTLIKLNQPAL